jgi:hypothetical protein
MNTDQLVVSNGTQHQVGHHRQATEVASLCKEIVTKTAQNIQGRRYVRVEGWQSVANAFGCVASAKDVERVETGYRAIGQVRRMDTGIVICEAEGFVGDDERTWSKRDEYAKRAMAQTRAISRACRSAFAFVVTMMDAGLETTPAEEVPHGGFDDAPRPAAPVRYQAASKPAPRIVDKDVIDVVPERIRNIAEDVVKLDTPDAKLRKRQPVAATPQAADYETVTFLKASRKSGTSAKGRDWTRWGALVNRNGSDVWLNTFDEAFGAIIDEANEGDAFNVELKEGERGIDIIDLRASDVPDKTETADALAEADEIPF